MARGRGRGSNRITAARVKRTVRSGFQDSTAEQNNFSLHDGLVQQNDISPEDNPDQQSNTIAESNISQQNSPVQQEEPLPLAVPKIVKFECTFENLRSCRQGDGDYFAQYDDNFGIFWCVEFHRNDGYMEVFLSDAKHFDEFILHVAYNVKINGIVTQQSAGEWNDNRPFRKCGTSKFMKWEELQDILEDDAFTLQVEIRIIKTIEVNGTPFQKFDEPDDLADVVLVVQDQKFHVAKNILATHSILFDDLFTKKSGGASNSEITLDGHDPRDVQNVLKIMYLEPALNESTVEGILHFAHYCKAESVKKMCEVFLLKKSKKSYDKTLDIFMKYNLNWRSVVDLMKRPSDVKSVLPMDIHSLNGDVAKKLLAKLASLC